MDKFVAKAALEQSEFFLYFPEDSSGEKFDGMGFYFRDIDAGLLALEYIESCSTSNFIVIDFVVANPNKLNIFIKSETGELITYALDVYANDMIISKLLENKENSHLRKTILGVFRAEPSDGVFVLHTLSEDDGLPIFIRVRLFGCTSK